MAGGSSDAATVLYGMNKLFLLGMTKNQMMEEGVKTWRGCTLLCVAHNGII